MIAVKEIGDCRHPRLMSPATIAGMTLRNRIILAAMGTEYVQDDGSLGARAMDYYEARAAGGAGMIVLETSSVAWPFGMSMPKMLGLSSDDFLPGLRQLAERVHAHDCRIAAQLNHSGKVSAHDVAEGRPILVPSIPKPAANDMGNGLTIAEMANFVRSAGPDGKGPRFKEMDQEDIGWVIDCFASAARRVVEAGFDAVEIHAGHGYLLSSFLSPNAKRRADDYGGPQENRARLLLAVVSAIKTELGESLPIMVRIDACEYRTQGGITLDDAVALAKLLDAAGCHAINVSAYSNNSAIGFTEGPLVHQPGAYIDFAKAIRAAVNIPVIAVGRIEPDVAERHIAAGDFDFLAMGRKLLADPELPNKLRDGRLQEIRPCIYCYVCVSQIFINKPLCCAVNPATGEEARLASSQPTAQPKNILVVGGGPAGMEAARVLAERGHRVSLWEKEDRLGGTLRVAALAYEPNGNLIDYLQRAVESSSVELLLGREATVADIAAAGFDSVVVAVGADRRAPALAGKDQGHVLDGEELRDMLFAGNAHGKLKFYQRLLLRLMHALKLNRDVDRMRSLSRLYMPVGKRVAIIGGGLVGVEVAELLAERGREVTILEPGRDFGAELSIVRRWRVLHGLKSHNVCLVPNAQVTAITAAELCYEQDGEAQRVVVDTVIVAQGAQANTTFEHALREAGVDVHNIGDSAHIGYIEGAIRSARELAVSL